MFNKKKRFDDMIGASAPMRHVYRLIEKVSKLDITVLITGESGTGKELVARSIHKRSSRSSKPFNPINTGAIAKELIASTLFGHEKGSFTGASTQKKGMFEVSNHATLFLDEISTMDDLTQVSLLRALESNQIQRVGGTGYIKIDVRLIAATNVNLEEEVEAGRFRKDLYYRLNVFSIDLPPLRKRGDDIILLAEEFLQRFNREFNKSVTMLSPQTKTVLKSYLWPGNVRQLENAIMRAVITAEGDTLTPEHLFPPSNGSSHQDEILLEVGTSLEDAEKQLILRTLKQTNQNKRKSAKLLGISRKALYNKLKRYNVEQNST